MAFLDNSGDIILDAVLTDTGRMRLAKGDGSFRIAKFALGDDEVDYSLFNSSNPSGSAYYDLEILQTPVLEAFTNNASSMKSKLLSISKNNLLYLPVIKINKNQAPVVAATTLVNDGYILAVDSDTQRYFIPGVSYYSASLGDNTPGILFGQDVTTGKFIRVDQGLDTTEIPKEKGLDADITETQYLVEIDNRFASLIATDNTTKAIPAYIDDDNIATYYFSRGVGTDASFVNDVGTADNSVNSADTTFAGPRGTNLQFKLVSQNEVAGSDYLFNQLGKEISAGFNDVSLTSMRSILTNIRITGVTTGNTIDIPLLVIKKISP